jgi:hypothetical protein
MVRSLSFKKEPALALPAPPPDEHDTRGLNPTAPTAPIAAAPVRNFLLEKLFSLMILIFN